MTYDPRTYWPARSRRQGASYVGPGGDATRSEVEAARFMCAIRTLHYGRPDYLRLLDFGCGSGRLAVTLAGICDEYTGADINGHAVTTWGVGHSIVQLEDDRIPFPDAHFDAVACVVVLQHIVSPAEFDLWTSEISRVLRPGGHAIVIDNVEVENPAPHMRPRGERAVAEALGCRVILRHLMPDHWAALMERV